MVGDIKPIAGLVGDQREYAAASKYVLGLDVLPLGRVVNNAKVTDHHAIIPTRAERHPVDKMAATTGASTTSSSGASWPSSIPRRCSRTRAWRRPWPATCSAPAAR